MHARVDQDLGDGVSQALSIQDADERVDRGRGILLPREAVGERRHGEVVTLLALLRRA
jgi:hypothetical protein